LKDLEIEYRQTRNGIEIRLSGQLQYSNAGEFRDSVPDRVRNCGSYVVLDMGSLTFIDTAGFSAIRYLSEACMMQSQHVQVINANVKIRNAVQGMRNIGMFEL